MIKELVKARPLFIKGILRLSENTVYEHALDEWYFHKSYKAAKDTFTHCICGQRIRRSYLMLNPATREKMYVGSACFRKFFGPKLILTREEEEELIDMGVIDSYESAFLYIINRCGISSDFERESMRVGKIYNKINNYIQRL